jgi:muramoyltetrapeptide carboxypeptidase
LFHNKQTGANHDSKQEAVIFLKPGDTLGVCAPSGSFDMEKFNRGIEILKTLGFQVQVPREIFQRKRYLAGDDMERAKIVNRLFSDPGIKGIICARGGYGALRILNHLDWDLIRKNPKPFMGYSDITAILTAILSETGMPVLHGPHVVSLATADAKTLASFVDALSGSSKTIEIPDGKAIREGIGMGILKGGNLATLCHLLGTRFQPDFAEAVLFFEDIGEPAYKIDRMLTQMKLAGLFDKTHGVITGSFENCDNGEYIEEIVDECFDEYQVPVLFGLDAGHGKTNLSLSFGRMIKMDTMARKIQWV